MHSRYPAILAFAVASFALTGCQSTSHEGAMVAQKIENPKAPNATIHLNQVVILDRALQETPAAGRAGKITVERHGGVRLPTGALEVYATFRNRTDHPLQLECRTQFYGSQQEPVERASAWQRVVLPPLGVETFRGASLGFANVASYYVEVREGR